MNETSPRMTMRLIIMRASQQSNSFVRLHGFECLDLDPVEWRLNAAPHVFVNSECARHDHGLAIELPGEIVQFLLVRQIQAKLLLRMAMKMPAKREASRADL